MLNNDVLRSVRYMLDLSDAKMVEILKLAALDVTQADVATYLKTEEEEGYVACPDTVMAHFLDGLVYFKRGKDETRPAPPLSVPISNNVVMKKLRVAFELKEDDLLLFLVKAGFDVSRPELSALFRKEGHKHFRRCGDQFLRNFLKALTQEIRG